MNPGSELSFSQTGRHKKTLQARIFFIPDTANVWLQKAFCPLFPPLTQLEEWHSKKDLSWLRLGDLLSETNSSDYKYQITGDKIDVPSQLYPRKLEFYWPSLSLPKVCFKLLFLKVRVRKWRRNSGKATVPKFRLHFLVSPSAAPYLYGDILRRGPHHIPSEK